MNRRGFLSALIGGLALDPEKLLWVPGKKIISIPRQLVKVGSPWHLRNSVYSHQAKIGTVIDWREYSGVWRKSMVVASCPAGVTPEGIEGVVAGIPVSLVDLVEVVYAN